eukprot:CAMPEP_0179052542 /NCGR_PEP_ID=MMETSP0796-20121207/21811_1 /TAXON_ID=73915 /ORGANISM="Pyrodinium bahamense, Strain pbaha01" /LENGTH=247 /DNA_ID=CAMNT_0020749111 /DNA_START=114 /DNA_END=857 /DNA_ORIENTATION=-
MWPVLADYALLFARICLAEVVLEIVYMGISVWAISSGQTWGPGGLVYPVLTIIANVQRLWMLQRMMRRLSETLGHETGHSPHVQGFCVLPFWLLSSVAVSTWYIILAVETVDTWIACTLAALAIVNFYQCFLWVYMLSENRASAGTYPVESAAKPGAMRIFRSRGDLGPALKFGGSCVICLRDLGEGQLIGQLPCGHAFHEPCISRWMNMKGCCPMRCDMPDAESEAALPSPDPEPVSEPADDESNV